MLKRDEMERLFRSHYGTMYCLARGILHDDEESKDVVGDVFARLVGSDMLPAADKIPAYLLMAVRNRCYDIISHRTVQERMRRLYPLDAVASVSNVEQKEEHLLAILQYAEANLTPQSHRIFRMRFEQGKQYKEIADELCISITAVYKHLSQALRKIRKHFNDNDYDD